MDLNACIKWVLNNWMLKFRKSNLNNLIQIKKFEEKFRI